MKKTKALNILKASAGSGKTFALTVHFIGLLLERPERYREVLALTFTNKATAEMKMRILGTLQMLAQQDLAQPETKDQSNYHRELLKIQPLWSRNEIKQQADLAYRYVLHDYSRFSVMTIDRFSQRVIRGFTYELGLDSGFRMEMNTDKVLRDLMDRLYEQLNDNQELFEWVLARMRAQIDSDKSWNINRELFKLASIIFNDDFKTLEEVSRRAGNEDLFGRMAELTKQQIDDFQQQVSKWTNQIADLIVLYNISEKDLLRRGGNFLFKFEKSRKDWDEHDKLLTNLEKFSGNIDAYQSEAKRTAAVEELFNQADPLITDFCHFLQENLPFYRFATAMDKNIHYLRLLKDMAALLADWRVEHGAQLISDAQLLLAKIGRTEQGDPTFIWEKMGNRYRNFLLDEFQDTSHAQWDNLLPLIVNALSTSSADRTAHLIVGDVKQSIYRWRNGDFRILLEGVDKNIKDAFHLQDSSALISHENLETNYRSEENIIQFNNYLYNALPAKFQELINTQAAEALQESYQSAWIDSGLHDVIKRAYGGAEQQVPPHKQGTGRGTVQLEFLGKDPGESGALNLTDFRKKACEKVFFQIAEWLESKKYQPGDIGILVRNNKDANLLVEYIKWRQSEGGHPFSVISGDALLIGGHDAIKCMIATLRFMAYEGREFNSYLTDIVFYYYTNKGQAVPEEAWGLCGKGSIEKLHLYLPEKLIHSWTELQMMPLATLVERLISYFDFDEDETAVPHLLQLRDMVAQYIKTGIPSLHRFLEYWDEEGVGKPLSGGVQKQAVEILTVHKSKGLEYDVVILPFCTWALKGLAGGQVWFNLENTYAADMVRAPLHFSKAVRESVLIGQYFEEELYNYMDALNTLYVATTRAKKHLYILANNPKGKSLSNVSDMLHEALLSHPAASDMEDTEVPLHILIEERTELESALTQAESLSPSDGEIPGEDPVLVLRGYPSTEALKHVLSSESAEDSIRSRQQQVSALFSSALHELMATVESEEDAEPMIDYLVMEGRIGVQERAQALKWIQQAWNHPDLRPYFKGDYQQSNEQSIIDAQGKTVRPDKVFFGRDETLVVDFKLSAELGHAEHLTQLRRYADHLREMGLPAVRAYLYYFIQNKTIAI